MLEKLDSFDLQLIACLQENARARPEQLSDQVPLSPSSIQRRVKRMKDLGIIEREIAVVSSHILKKAVQFMIGLRMKTKREDLLQPFRKKLQSAPEVQQCYFITGQVDMLVICTVPDMESFRAFLETSIKHEDVVERFETSFVTETVKKGLAVDMGVSRETTV